jgi:penicillin amidase
MDKNPVRGFVSSANQFPVDKTYPYYITSTSFEAYRNRRINQLLNEKNNLTVEDMMRIQNDNFNLKASESLPFFLSQLDSSALTKEELAAWQILKSWNFMNDINSQGASYYEAWWNNLLPMTWDEMGSAADLLQRPTSYQTIRLMKEQPDLKFFDIQETTQTENARDVIRASFKSSVQKIEAWKKEHGDTVAWGIYKDGFIGHLLPPMKALSVPVIAGGNKDIVNAHSRTHGPSWRMIVSLEKSGVKGWGVYPGGQSGNPGSKYYNNMISRWSTGQYYPLQFLKEAQPDENTGATLTTLNPK